jgi:LysR family glycine cleavage system transcriptional activator
VLRSFEAAARHQSFTLAAEELHLSQSAISRQVRELEGIVGTDLFHRAGRRVILTKAGRDLAGQLSIDLDCLRQTVFRAMTAGDRGGVLRVAVLPAFASRWLIPRLPDLARQHPELRIDLGARIAPFNLANERFDMAIHFGQRDWPESEMEHLCHETLLAVASPGFAQRHAITGPEALSQAPLLHLETRPFAWSDWFRDGGLGGDRVYPGQSFDQFSMIIAGAVHGLGAALLPSYLIEKELAEGSLVQLDARQTVTDNSYFIVTSPATASPRTAAFAAWLKSRVSERQPGDSF